ncbi:MAG: 1-deoxy-D-xylulose-5-phosphate reductoisomerase, partial [Sphingomonadaceae bacterium]
MTRTITLLGATGSIGTSTLDLVARNPERFRIHAVASGRDWAKLAEIARAANAAVAVIADESGFAPLRDALADTPTDVRAGAEAMVATAAETVDLVVAAIVGAAGLAPTLAALEAGTTVALANKEALICAGDVMTAAARRSGARILPVDSEH